MFSCSICLRILCELFNKLYDEFIILIDYIQMICMPIFIYFDVLDLCCCMGSSSSCSESGLGLSEGFLISIAVHGPFIEMASLVWIISSGALGLQESQHMACSSLGSWDLEQRL